MSHIQPSRGLAVADSDDLEEDSDGYEEDFAIAVIDDAQRSNVHEILHLERCE